MKLPKRANIKIFSIFLLIFVVFFLLSKKFGIFFNQSPSFKERMFFVKKNINPQEAKKGDIVTFYKKHPLENKTLLFAKRIVCDEGDLFESKGDSFFCNTKLIAIAKHIEGIRIFATNAKKVPKKYMFVATPHKDSYDSRYFGFVAKSDIKGLVLWKK